MKTYDVIVIGAGNGGLAAAANCAKAGLSTLLLERHNIPGGSASSFVRGRLYSSRTIKPFDLYVI